MNSKSDFISRTVQIGSSLLTLGGLISQYFFREEFKTLLNITGEDNYYEAFSVAGLILGIILIIMLFSNRTYFHTKLYLNKKKKQDYLNSFRNLSQEKTKEEQETTPQVLSEPFYLNINRISYFVFLLSIIFFILIFQANGGSMKSFWYLLFLLSIVFSSAVSVIQIYNREDWLDKKSRIKENIHSRIQEHFAPDYKVKVQYELAYANPPSIQLLIEVEEKEYLVVTSNLDPDSYFEIKPFEHTADVK